MAIEETRAFKGMIRTTREIPNIGAAGDVIEAMYQEGRIDGVGFDLYETLIRVGPGWDSINTMLTRRGANIARQHGLDVDTELYGQQLTTALRRARFRRHQLLQESSLSDIYTAVVSKLPHSGELDPESSGTLVQELCDNEVTVLGEVMVPKEGAIPMLKKVAGLEIPRGIYSNTPAGHKDLVKILDQTGITNLIPPEHIISSSDTGFVKPHHKSVEITAKTLGIEPDRIAYVGDRDIDVIAAKNARAWPIRILRQK